MLKLIILQLLLLLQLWYKQVDNICVVEYIDLSNILNIYPNRIICQKKADENKTKVNRPRLVVKIALGSQQIITPKVVFIMGENPPQVEHVIINDRWSRFNITSSTCNLMSIRLNLIGRDHGAILMVLDYSEPESATTGNIAFQERLDMSDIVVVPVFNLSIYSLIPHVTQRLTCTIPWEHVSKITMESTEFTTHNLEMNEYSKRYIYNGTELLVSMKHTQSKSYTVHCGNSSKIHVAYYPAGGGISTTRYKQNISSGVAVWQLILAIIGLIIVILLGIIILIFFQISLRKIRAIVYQKFRLEIARQDIKYHQGIM